jgi:catechol 2,3-dioxygenase-like lactoylglutathione lyase family enzyme
MRLTSASLVFALEPALKFYRDILGCQEIARAGPKEKPRLVYLRVPDGENWVEFEMYNMQDPSVQKVSSETVDIHAGVQFPDLARLGVFHHMGMTEMDVAKCVAIFEASPARKSYTRPLEVRGTPPWQFQFYDPDGSRFEIMLPGVAGRGNTPPSAR